MYIFKHRYSNTYTHSHMYVCIYVGTVDPWSTWGLGALTVRAGNEDVALHIHGSFTSADSIPGFLHIWGFDPWLLQ